jgi:hypothetical protein
MKRTPLIDLVCAFVLLLVVALAYSYWYGSVSKRSAEASQLTQEISALGEVGGRAGMVRRSLDELAHHETQVYRHLIGNSTIVAFLEEVEATGDHLGADVEVESVGTGKTGQLQMSARITGSFDSVMRTLGAIEYQAYDTTLTTLTLNSSETASSTVWIANASFTVGMPPTFPTGSTTPKTP